MIITFCGHSDFYEKGDIAKRVQEAIEEAAKGEKVEFFLGGYGNFDRFAYSRAKEYKEKHNNAKIIFVTPYQTESYLEYKAYNYDEIIYPFEDKVIPRFAITYRNKWIIERSDFVIAYVKRSFGGAYKMLKQAEKAKKQIFYL